MKTKNILRCVLSLILLIAIVLPNTVIAKAASGPSVVTTLSDNIIQYGSKKTFDVWAKNASGKKIRATVKLNGTKVDPTWDDNEKTSYTLHFIKEGKNTVTVSASSDGGKKKELTYRITYVKANTGDKIGVATWSVEMFTIGCGYLIYPVEMPIYEGETSAEQLLRLLRTSGFVGYYGGSVKSSFYLAYIADGTASGAKYNNYQKSGTPTNPKRLNLSPRIPDLLEPHLKKTMTFYDPNDYISNWKGYLGEFAFTNGSGWMYSVNNVFPNVGFADCYLSDGDTVRVQYTLGYGADIGGFGSVGTKIPDVDNSPSGGYYRVADKDALGKAICKARASGAMSAANVKKAYESALNVMEALNASQGAVNSAELSLKQALSSPKYETASANGSTETSGKTTAQSSPTSTAAATNGRTEKPTSKPKATRNSSPKPTESDTANTQITDSVSCETVSKATTETASTEKPTAKTDSTAAKESEKTAENSEAVTESGSVRAADNTSVEPQEKAEEKSRRYEVRLVAVAAVLVLAAGAFALCRFRNNKRSKGSQTDE